MSVHGLRAVVSLLLCGTIVSVGRAESPVIPPFAKELYRSQLKIGDYKARNTSTWDRWYKARQTLGMPKTNESYVRATAAGLQTEGTAMRFENGMVVRIGTSPRAGRTSLLYGGIFNKYEEFGGLHGTLGFPISDAYQLGQTGNYAQIFEKGQIYFNPATRSYEVRYFPQ